MCFMLYRAMSYDIILESSIYIGCLLFITSNDVFINGEKQYIEVVTKLMQPLDSAFHNFDALHCYQSLNYILASTVVCCEQGKYGAGTGSINCSSHGHCHSQKVLPELAYSIPDHTSLNWNATKMGKERISQFLEQPVVKKKIQDLLVRCFSSSIIF